jgi:para-aminobenzoate synthetase/4-amino-4-deoxychorismate lyase
VDSLNPVPIVTTPRREAGVFETMLVWEDQPIELEAHLARLDASARQLFGRPAPDSRELVLANSRGGGVGRLRLDLRPTADGSLRTSVIVSPFDRQNVFPAPPLGTDLKSILVDRGYGDHKWIDRDMLTRAEATVGAGAAPLLVGPDETVLEASRANVFAVRGGTLVTPPLDGSILPGVARTGVLETAAEIGIECSEARIDLRTILQADQIFLTGSLRGVEPVRSLDDTDFPVAGPVTLALAEGLRRRWLG